MLTPMLLLVVGSRLAGGGAEGVAATLPATTAATESILAVESSEDRSATRPTAWLTVDGGDGDVFYRGWPMRIELHTAITGPAMPTAAITIHGPVDVSPQPAAGLPGVWLVSPDHSAAMPAGKYVISVGTAQADVAIADEPATLSPARQEAKHISRTSYALAMNDLATAERFARDGAAASPTSPAAQTMLGDVLSASGKPAEALAAYTEAINLTPPAARPPAELLTRASELRREIRASSTTRPATTSPAAAAAAAAAADSAADESTYYKLITQGDTARRGGKLPDALRAYQSAQRYHQGHKMKLPTRELDEKLAYLRDLQQKQPPVQPRRPQPQRPQAQKPQATRPATAPR
jgi:tetratricopeptide (TPR) repeat protein